METFNILIGLYFAGGLFSYLYFATDNPDSFQTAVGIFGMICLALAIFATYRQISNSRERSSVKALIKKTDCITIEEDGSKAKSITVRKQCSVLAKCISVSQFYYRETNYTDPTLVYTGATVGSVHTGGFHVNPGTEKAGAIKKTNKYQLYLWPYDTILQEIILADEALAEAKKDKFISSFLSGNRIILRHQGRISKFEQDIMKDYLLNNNQTAAQKNAGSYITGQAVVKTKLTKEECKAILNWLAGK